MSVLSIIVPVYNVEKYLSQCVESILSQTFEDWELILVDDGSPDNSSSLCDLYSSKDARIRVIHKENGGVSSARNVGIENARGEWVTFIDADDFVSPTFFERLYLPIKENPDIDFVQAGCTNYTNGQHQSIEQKYEDLISSDMAYVFNRFRGLTISKLFRLENVNQWPDDLPLRFDEKMKMAEDMAFTLDYLATVKKYAFVSEVGYFYRRDNAGSLTKRMWLVDFDRKMHSWKHIYSGFTRMMKMHEFDINDVLPRVRLVMGSLFADIKLLCRMHCPLKNKIGYLKQYTNEELELLSYSSSSWVENELINALRQGQYYKSVLIGNLIPVFSKLSRYFAIGR